MRPLGQMFQGQAFGGVLFDVLRHGFNDAGGAVVRGAGPAAFAFPQAGGFGRRRIREEANILAVWRDAMDMKGGNRPPL